MTVDPTTPPERGAVGLSVVIITENEEDRVRECIESVFEACRAVPSFEVILVDSASTDRTVEYAAEYPITVLRIPEEHTVSCGAGRYVGDRVARGELVLHVDGDMTLTKSWLPRAIEQLGDPQVVAVEGNLDTSTQTGVKDVDKVGGVMLYDATALAAVGGFDPYLLGYEDVDVGFRLKEAGYRLVRLPEVSAVHNAGEGFSEPVQRWRQGYLIAPGQTVRKWAHSPSMLWRLIRRQRYKVALGIWLGVGVLSLLSGTMLLGWLLLSLVGFGVVASKLGIVGAARIFLAKGMGVVGLIEGLRTPTPPAEEYPLDAVEVLREGQVHEGAIATDDR
ncbi:glycosyltransferase family 2 protein [Halodesulfurarchaeum formicicum]|uniref:Glycosyl transferase family 2 n=1 Tax=Halodesulfurarchaeum formicicum TaxID=1873524 RepID=A0A1J1AAD1_9EURY|nr:glycosyltransferase [Halodesulfurarchaeum formicicum]APE95098.1 glycosyl transferase family 2 [Halodesulfurarchaeum formicicum]